MLVGYVDAQIRARVSGHLLSLDYKEGSPVKAGDLLVELDTAEAEAGWPHEEIPWEIPPGSSKHDRGGNRGRSSAEAL